MKKVSLIIMLFIIGLSAKAQDTTKTKQYLNEFGIDATGFLKQYLSLGSQQYPTYYSPAYYLTYRRHFTSGNLRVEIGGDFTNNQLAPESSNDTNKYYNRGYSLYASIGWEFYENLSKKWQVYYGADFRISLTDYKNDAQYWNGGYANGIESKAQVYAFAPFLGIRFKITKRLSILTEASYSINWEKDNNRTYYIPLIGAILPVPQPTNQSLTKMYTAFSQPLSVFIDFTL